MKLNLLKNAIVLHQYENNLISDFDLLIIGGYYNDKRTAVDSFLLAVLMKPNNNDDGVFHAVCKIRNGLKRSQFAEILSDLQPYRHEIRNGWKESPPDIEWANANPNFWFDPKHSIVLQIKASELTKTTTYRTSHSFRFPRVMKIRRDKMWSDVCTLNEFQTFCTVSLTLFSPFFLINSVVEILMNASIYFTVRLNGGKINQTTRDIE